MVDITTLKRNITDFKPVETIQKGFQETVTIIRETVQEIVPQVKSFFGVTTYPTWKMEVMHPMSPKKREEIWGVANYDLDFFTSCLFFKMFDKDEEFYGIGFPTLDLKKDLFTKLKTTTPTETREFPSWKMKFMHPMSDKHRLELYGRANYDLDKLTSFFFQKTFGLIKSDLPFSSFTL